MNYEIYTDGACSGNPGPGGYAAIILAKGRKKLIICGGKKSTTNNHMELLAIVRALDHVLKGEGMARQGAITIKSDSAYCINSINEGWYKFWERNGWKTKDNKEVKNKELWIRLNNLLQNKPRSMSITFDKVKGHSGNIWNEKVDGLARKSLESIKEKRGC